jgi:ribosomal protein S18 acetylase RimI-like enzyme
MNSFMESHRSSILTPQALADTPHCVELIAQVQRRIGQRCLHSDFDVTASAYRAERAEEMIYAVCFADAAQLKPTAILGAEVADDLQRAWLRGPFFLVDAHEQRQGFEAASEAFAALMQSCAKRARTWDAYIEVSHRRAREWYEAHGFVQKALHSVYAVKREHACYRSEPEVREPITDIEIDAIAALASESFPGGYLTRESFAAPASDEAITLTISDREGTLGYVHATYERGAIEAFVDNLAVAAHARRRGIGRKLLNAALAWAIEQRAAPQVALVVRDGNTNARALYESVGFSLLADGVHLRLETT